ncbi:MAG: zinc-ribbon domain-containing protein [Clostridia bacterium]|nr:zinc-ribbon domain-containing protein [Clostridia bacterium]
MFCSKCGKQLPDDIKFCFNCGASISVPESEVKNEVATKATLTDQPVAETPIKETSTKQEFSEKQPKNKKKLPLLAITAALLIVIILIVTVFTLLFSKGDLATAVDAYIDKDGTAYICYDDGKSIKLGGEAREAQMTPDGKHIVVVEDKGQVYWRTTSKNSDKYKLADTDDNINVTAVVTNDFIFLAITEEANNNVHEARLLRYSFKSDKTVTILEFSTKADGSEEPPFFDFYVSKSYGVDDISVIAAYDGDISILKPNSETLENIASYKKEEKIALCGVSADGNTAVWTSTENGKYAVILYRNGAQETVSQDYLEAPDITSNNYQSYLSDYLNETYDPEKYGTISDYANAVMEKWAKSEESEGNFENTDENGGSNENAKLPEDAESEEATEKETDRSPDDAESEEPTEKETDMNDEEETDPAEPYPEVPAVRSTTSTTPSQSTIIKKLKDYFRTKGNTPTFQVNVDPNNKVMTIDGANRSILIKGRKIEENKLPSNLHSLISYSTNGLPIYQDMNINKAKGYYVITSDTTIDSNGVSKTTQTVYLIAFKDGERVKLVSDVTQCTFSEDKILFVEEDSLKMAKVDMKKAELVDEQKVANDVHTLIVADANSDYIYFTKNYSSTDVTTDLYVYDVKDGESEKIESDIFPYVTVGTDGLNVYFFTDVASTSALYGTFKVYNVKKEKITTIAGDVIVGSSTSRLLSGEMDPKYIWYARYQNSTDTSYEYNVCFYNGKESVSVVKNLEN